MVNFLEYRKNIHEQESKKVPPEAISGRVKSLYDSGRYDITPEHDYDGKGGIEFHAIAKRPPHAEEFQPRKAKNQKNSWHDPKISSLHTPHPEDEFPRTHAKLKPDSGYTQDVQDKPTKGVLFRGMSHEEFHGIQKSGKIQSKGAMNMGKEQEGLTYYSRDPSQAQHYAHSFAHAEHKATGQHHAYVVAVKDPGTEVKVKGTGENEVGIPHAIKKEDILHVHVGRAYHGGHGSESSRKTFSGFESGSGSTPDTSVGWKKLTKSLPIKESESYQGEHSAPDHENGMPAHNLSGMYPDDIHTIQNAARHYGDEGGSAMDHESISVIHSVKDKPNRAVKIYRAVPKVLSHVEKLDKIKLEMAHHMRHGKPHPSTESKLTGSAYYNQLHKEHAELSSKPTPTDEPSKIKINKGDWVTTSKAYAVDHGKSNLKNNYRVLSKTVKAKEIFNDGNSIHEWGYHPHVKESTGDKIADIYLDEIYEAE